MKRTLLNCTFFVFTSSLFAQSPAIEKNERFEVWNRNESKFITSSKLQEAASLQDFIPEYSEHWMTAVVVRSQNDGKEITSSSNGKSLSPQQQQLIKAADLCSELQIDIAYNFKNYITGALQTSTIHYRAQVVPEVQAQFPGGHMELTAYLKEKVYDEITEHGKKTAQFQGAVIQFVVEEDGRISDASLNSSMTNEKEKSLLLQAISEMPKWSSAELNGKKVKQTFTYNISGYGRGGC
jgi:hypothetical protein